MKEGRPTNPGIVADRLKMLLDQNGGDFHRISYVPFYELNNVTALKAPRYASIAEIAAAKHGMLIAYGHYSISLSDDKKLT